MIKPICSTPTPKTSLPSSPPSGCSRSLACLGRYVRIEGQRQTVKRLFHYTTESRLRSILEARVINLATLYVRDGVKPVAWFSYRQDWEQTATPALIENGISKQLTFGELVEIESPARIEIDPQAAPLDWREYRKQSGERSRDLKALESVAIHQGASSRRGGSTSSRPAWCRRTRPAR